MIKRHKITAIIFIIFALQTGFLYAGGTKEKPLESESFLALGTTCTISLYGGGQQYFTESENIISGIENRMSVNIEDSEVSSVNAAAGKSGVRVSDDVFEVISAGLKFSELSSGTFDISIGPLVSLWGIGGSGTAVPPEEKILDALSHVDYRKVKLEADNTIYLPEKGMALEPGGIAKGYAADAVAGYLRSSGVKSGLINLGGNVLALGTKPDGSSWRIGIQNPDSARGDYIGIVKVEDKAVVTSGKYERFFIGEDGKRYHHILSTETGFPVENGIAQVSIITAESMTADAMSTTVFSLGLEKGLKLAESMPELEAIIVMEDDTVYLTEGMKQSFSLTDPAFKLAQ